MAPDLLREYDAIESRMLGAFGTLEKWDDIGRFDVGIVFFIIRTLCRGLTVVDDNA